MTLTWQRVIEGLFVQKDDLKVAKNDGDKDSKEEGRQLFTNLAGKDGEIDAFELQDILNKVFMKGSSAKIPRFYEIH